MHCVATPLRTACARRRGALVGCAAGCLRWMPCSRLGLLRCGRSVCARVSLRVRVRPARSLGRTEFMRLRLEGMGKGGRAGRSVASVFDLIIVKRWNIGWQFSDKVG